MPDEQIVEDGRGDHGTEVQGFNPVDRSLGLALSVRLWQSPGKNGPDNIDVERCRLPDRYQKLLGVRVPERQINGYRRNDITDPEGYDKSLSAGLVHGRRLLPVIWFKGCDEIREKPKRKYDSSADGLVEEGPYRGTTH